MFKNSHWFNNLVSMAFEPHKKVKNFYHESKHILSIAYKPTTQSFTRTLKVVVLGILILGFLGYFISLIINFLV